MKLDRPFFRLPLRFDSTQLLIEARQFLDSEWQRHPTGFDGNSAIRLISIDGREDDGFAGEMKPTPQLARCPYIAQTLAHFGQVWSRSRLMRLAPGARVPAHSDVNYHWFHRVRVHIPIQTDPLVKFTSGGETVHMAAGEAWIFDNWKPHEVDNGSSQERIHLVADTCGNSAFWRMVSHSQSEGFDSRTQAPGEVIPFQPDLQPNLYCERFNAPAVMHPSEVEQLSMDLLGDIARPTGDEESQASQNFLAIVAGFCREWRTLWSLFGDRPEGWEKFALVRNHVAAQIERISGELRSASNGTSAKEIFLARVLMYSMRDPTAIATEIDRTMSQAATQKI
jgi:hypothetical protein